MIANPYWHLPLWLPRWLRNFIMRFEPYDQWAFEQNCRIVAEKRDYMFADDWLLVAAEVHLYAEHVGVSPQWLAFIWSQPEYKG